MEWGEGATDPEGTYYVNINEMPWLMSMVETRRPDGTPLVPGERDYMIFCAPCHGLDKKGNPAAELLSLVDVAQRKTRAEIELITRQGGGARPVRLIAKSMCVYRSRQKLWMARREEGGEQAPQTTNNAARRDFCPVPPNHREHREPNDDILNPIDRHKDFRQSVYATMPEAKRTLILNYVLGQNKPLSASRKEPGTPTEKLLKTKRRTTPSGDSAAGSTRRAIRRSNHPGEPLMRRI